MSAGGEAGVGVLTQLRVLPVEISWQLWPGGPRLYWITNGINHCSWY